MMATFTTNATLMKYLRLLVILLMPLSLFAQNKVGINTDAPLSHLDVRSTDDTDDGAEFQLATPSMTNFLRFFGGRLGDRNPVMAFHDDDTFHIVTTLADWSTYTSRITLLPTGRMGIGTSLPLAKLDIRALGDGAEILRFTTDRPWVFKQRGSGVNTKLTLQTTTNDKAFEILSQDGLNRVAAFFSNNTHSNVLLVPDGGEAGVGIAEDPTGKFHIRHNSNSGWPQLRLTEVGEDYARIKMENDANPSVFWDIAALSDSVLTNSKVNFYYSGPNGTGDRMTITGAGKVGINKTNPEAELDIRGGDWNLDGGTPGDLRIGSSAANAFRIGVATGGGGAGTARMYSQGGGLLLGTNNIPHLTITTAGKVGIGTTNPIETLHVAGTMRVSSLAGSGDRNVIVDANGKFKIGTTGQGDTDWLETDDQVSTLKEVYIDSPGGPTSSVTVVGKASNGNNFSSLSLYNDAFFGGTYRRLLMDANDLDAFRGTGVDPIHEALNIQRLSSGNLYLTNGGGKVGIGTTAPGSKLTVNGSDNNGTTATLELNSSGTHKLLLDGNEIDNFGSALYINGNSSANVGIGTLDVAAGYKLSVRGKIIAEEVRVQLYANWPDYVFEEDYALTPLEQLGQQIKDAGHLPGIPSAAEIEENGLHLGDMQRKMMEKIEELTLHMISLHERIETLERENVALRSQSDQ
jgi:hypothetical protein